METVSHWKLQYVHMDTTKDSLDITMGESNTVVTAYTLYRHLQQYCSHPVINTTCFPLHGDYELMSKYAS